MEELVRFNVYLHDVAGQVAELSLQRRLVVSPWEPDVMPIVLHSRLLVETTVAGVPLDDYDRVISLFARLFTGTRLTSCPEHSRTIESCTLTSDLMIRRVIPHGSSPWLEFNVLSKLLADSVEASRIASAEYAKNRLSCVNLAVFLASYSVCLNYTSCA